MNNDYTFKLDFEFAFDNINSFPDFKITCKDNEDILVHKLFLSRSKYFHTMFCNNFSENTNNHVIFSDISKTNISFILKFFSGYKIDKHFISKISLDELKCIFEKIHLFQIEEIYPLIVQFLYEHPESNIFDTYEYLSIYDTNKIFLPIFEHEFISLIRTQKIEMIIEHINEMTFEVFISNFGNDIYDELIKQITRDFSTVCLFDCWAGIPKNIKVSILEKIECSKDYYIEGRNDTIRMIEGFGRGDFILKNSLIEHIKLNVRKIIR